MKMIHLQVRKFEDIDARRLMDLYQEGNQENADYFYPEWTDREAAVTKVENDFLEYIRGDFFCRAGSCYHILEQDGIWVSALRLYDIGGGLYYIEALETHPDYRRQGYASRLMKAVLEELKHRGPFRVCDNVGRKNAASLATHESSGFRIVRETGYDYLRKVDEENTWGLEFVYNGWPRA